MAEPSLINHATLPLAVAIGVPGGRQPGARPASSPGTCAANSASRSPRRPRHCPTSPPKTRSAAITRPSGPPAAAATSCSSKPCSTPASGSPNSSASASATSTSTPAGSASPRARAPRTATSPSPPPSKRPLALHISAARDNGAAFLFESSWKKPYSTRGVRAMLARYAAKAGLAHNMPPHRLRHFLFTWLKGRRVALDATFRVWREEGAARDGASGAARRRSRPQGGPAGQGGRDRTVLRQMPGCCVHSGCIRRKHDAAKATKKRSDEGRCHYRRPAR